MIVIRSSLSTLAAMSMAMRRTSSLMTSSGTMCCHSFFLGKSSAASPYSFQRWNRFLSFSSVPSQSSSVEVDGVDGKSNGKGPPRLFPEELNIIYDSKCNICNFEINFLANRDERISGSTTTTRKLRMTDIEDENYNPDDPANGGISYAKGMSAMHAVTADGRVMEGVPVFSSAYELVGLGWLFKFTEWPVLKNIVRWGYDVFARYRTNVTRGSSLEELIQAYEAKQKLENSQTESDCQTCSTDAAKRA
eukprot:scaffold497_cov97-Cylindrotheca_fusiformis.AAC.1